MKILVRLVDTEARRLVYGWVRGRAAFNGGGKVLALGQSGQALTVMTGPRLTEVLTPRATVVAEPRPAVLMSGSYLLLIDAESRRKRSERLARAGVLD